MEGQILSHYKVVRRLGGGGMGVVYEALDTHLDRSVALKFLPPELTRDDDARQRFVQEAKAASALDHPNICTVYEIDTTPDGQLFIAMACYDGETLKKRIERGPLPVAEALDLAAQVAQGLQKAHDAGIVHRDIKPANLMVTSDGIVKILDFGIAKLTGSTGLTRTGSTLGTVSYMAPEQFRASGADRQTDLWALGVVLYEMLTGSQPFRGDHPMAVMQAVLNDPPTSLHEAVPNVPPQLESIVARALEKDTKARYASAAAFRSDLAGCRAAVTAPRTSEAMLLQLIRRPRVAVPALLVLGALGASAVWAWTRASDVRWARDEALPEILRLVERDEYRAAYALAERAERYAPDDPILAGVWGQISDSLSLATVPDGADVYAKAYDAPDESWTLIGRTPFSDVRLPRGIRRIRIEKDGFETLDLIDPSGLVSGPSGPVELLAKGNIPTDMVRVPVAGLRLTMSGFDFTQVKRASPYAIDRFEVTNKAYKAFVDSNGYENRAYWQQPFVKDGHPVPWADAMREFRDSTGRPGPSTWRGGTYPEGQGDYPVEGVSWYEAAAYAAFTGRHLPTVYHWSSAAGIFQAPLIMALSNFGNDGPRPVGSHAGVGPFGTYDMAGNVREWCWNETTAGAAHYALGGAWNDSDYQFTVANARPPFDRSPGNGFRTVQYEDGEPASTLTAPVEFPSRDYAREQPVSDEIFRVYRDQYAYDAQELDARVEKVETPTTGWRLEKVTFNAAYDRERVSAYLFLPANVKPPYQTLLYFPGATAVMAGSSDRLKAGLGPLDPLNSILLSGRAVLFPIYYGTFERNDGRRTPWPELTPSYRDWTIRQVKDARRAVDYLATRADIDHDRLGYFGVSWGVQIAPPILALEPRVKTAIFVSGGFTPAPVLPEVDPLNFATRVSIPVLMLNGDGDNIYPLEPTQKPLFARLGASGEHKRHVLYNGGHDFFMMYPRQFTQEALAWLDTHLGPVR